MGCLTGKLTRVGGISVSFDRVSSGISVSLDRVNSFMALLTRIGGDIQTSHVRVGGDISVSFGLVCSPNISGPYLNIEPTVLWVYPNLENTNDVYSNTEWEIN